MKNDVVRWSAVKNEINSNCKYHNKNSFSNNCIANIVFSQHAVNEKLRQHAANISNTTRTFSIQKQVLLQYDNGDYDEEDDDDDNDDENNDDDMGDGLHVQQFKTASKCDKIDVYENYNILFKQLQQQTPHSRHLYKNRKSKEQKEQQEQKQEEEEEEEEKEEKEEKEEEKSQEQNLNKSTTQLISNRTLFLCSFNLTKILFIILKISALVFLYNLNIGFVTGVTALSELPLELDYENAAAQNRISEDTNSHYTHTWAVHIPKGDDNELADKVARDHGFINLGKIFDGYYHFAHHKVIKRSLMPAYQHQNRLDDDKRVHWAKQQTAKSRRKRDFIRMRPSRTSSRMLSLVDAVSLSDPKWSQMWYLNRGGGLDMNVIPAWKEGITGKGIVVTILDDGLESDHPDIEHNYDPKASYDVNSHDEDPMPHYDMTDSNRHGTRCAGEVAATANNSICAVGIAFGASVGGVRMLDGDVTDAVEARSLSLNPQHIDIYSASWGPDDDGKTVDGPGELASRAFIEGVTKGRNGKGSIFIWASGNGGRELDNCNCDGYTNSIWTLSISSATEEGHVPWYSEKCSSTLATTYSSGGQNEKQVVTTDLHHSCTISHTGTSASAPLAAGIAALVLESNQNLTWRDLQHIVVRTAKPANLKDQTWSKNGVGRRISHSFGYGLMDAAAMVKVARNWKTVPEQQRCEINAPHVDKVIPPKSYITLQLVVQHCSSVNYLEHVQAKITLTSQRRGDLQLYLKSPAGTKVTLLTSRVHDVSRSGFNQWPFMSVHTWGESPHGNWQLEIHNEGRYLAQITEWELIFYGTEIPAQPDDPVQISPGQFSPYGNEMEHNDIEYDPDRQLRNMQQIGESSLTSKDKTNSSCLQTTINQRCLVCAPPTYLFNGSCFDECPVHTYATPINIITKGNEEKINNNNKNNESSSNNNDSSSNNLDTEEDLQLTDRRKRQRPFRSMNEIEDMLTPPLRLCSICDATCYRCHGPLNSQCSTCYPGSQLHKEMLTNETFCYTFAERSSGIAPSLSDNAHKNIKNDAVGADIILFLIIIIPALILIPLIVCLQSYVRNNCWQSNNATQNATAANAVSYSYDRVALLSDDNNDDSSDVSDAEIEIFSTPDHAQPLKMRADHQEIPLEIECVTGSETSESDVNILNIVVDNGKNQEV